MDMKDRVRPVKAGQHGICWLVGAVALLALLAFLVLDMLPTEGMGTASGEGYEAQAELVALGGGELLLEFRVSHDHAVEKLGIMSIRVYGSEDGQSWSEEQVLTEQDAPQLMRARCCEHQGVVALTGESGRYYRVSLVFWAGDREENWSKTFWTGSVRA